MTGVGFAVLVFVGELVMVMAGVSLGMTGAALCALDPKGEGRVGSTGMDYVGTSYKENLTVIFTCRTKLTLNPEIPTGLISIQ